MTFVDSMTQGYFESYRVTATQVNDLDLGFSYKKMRKRVVKEKFRYGPYELYFNTSKLEIPFGLEHLI